MATSSRRSPRTRRRSPTGSPTSAGTSRFRARRRTMASSARFTRPACPRVRRRAWDHESQARRALERPGTRPDAGHMTNSDTIALVTGANKGIGRETVRRLAEQGWTVWLGSRDPDRGQQAAAELQSAGDVRPVELDVTDDESVSSAAKTIETSGGRLDVLVNNAGIGGPWIGAQGTEPHHLLPVFGVNLLGPVRTTPAF